jgi:delta-aminolevulinic acid dehydratase/porphobilinogen synthase
LTIIEYLNKRLDQRLKLWRNSGEFNKLVYMNNDDLLHTEKILADRKTFYLDLKQNARGKVVKITEDVSGNRDTIMVPAEILSDFIAALTDIQTTSDEN